LLALVCIVVLGRCSNADGRVFKMEHPSGHAAPQSPSSPFWLVG
jgi:hypothetical protein